MSWDEALDTVAAGIRAAQAERGPDGVAVFGGGGLTNEKAYSLGKLARAALGTSQIDYNGRWCMSSAASAGIRAFGLDRGLPFPLADVEETDVLVLVGSNLAETMPPAARHLDRLRERGGRVVVIDPRRTPTADRADLALQPVPGTDLALALGVLHLLVAAGAVDEDYLAARTTGWAGVKDSVASWWPERVERVTGISAGGGAGARGDARRVPSRHGPHRPGRRAALHRLRHRARLDQRRPRAGHGRHPGRGLRLPHRPGQRPGRPRARAEGRPAARLPPDRRPRRPRARRGRLGSRPRVAARPRAVGVRAARRARHRRRSLGDAGLRVQHRGQRAQRHARHDSGSSPSTCWSSATS